jgi:glycosyltransferase involved in cell wall biosynthesis
VRLLGAVPLDRLMPQYREYDVFVLPTRPGEGIPRVLLEAMAGGMPIVTTSVSGITSLITDRVNGVLTGGSADDMATALYDVMTDVALRRRLIAAGYETAKAHTLERQAAAMMRVVSETLGVPMRLEPRVA